MIAKCSLNNLKNLFFDKDKLEYTTLRGEDGDFEEIFSLQDPNTLTKI